jgi:glycosyl hydrolase family 18 (putative chitinase)
MNSFHLQPGARRSVARLAFAEVALCALLVFFPVAAGADGARSATHPNAAALTRLWAVQVDWGAHGWLARPVLSRVRQDGINALVLRVSALGSTSAATKAFDSARAFATAANVKLIAVLPAGRPRTPAARHASAACSSGRLSSLRCAVEAPSVVAAAKLARRPDALRPLVAVDVSGPRSLSRLAPLLKSLRRQVIVVAPLYQSFNASLWRGAIEQARAIPSVGMAVAPQMRNAAPAVQRFAALLRGGGSVSGPMPPPPSQSPRTRQVVMGDDIGWALARSIPWSDLTEISLFALQTTKGTGLDTSFLDGVNLRAWTAAARAHGVESFIQVGGIDNQNWEVACNDTNRAGFVANLVNYAVSKGFDGIDLDIEDNLWSSQAAPVAAMTTCINAVATAAHASRSRVGKTLRVIEEVTTNWMGSWIAPSQNYLDEIHLMTFGNTTNAQFLSDVQATIGEGVTQSAKFVLGIDDIDFPDDPDLCGRTAAYAKQQGWAGTELWSLRSDTNYGCLHRLAAGS